MKKLVQLLKQDTEMNGEIRSLLKSGINLPIARRNNVSSHTVMAMIEDPERESSPAIEAMILDHARPSLLIKNDKIELPDSIENRKRMLPYIKQLENRSLSVGRVEFKKQGQYPWGGTGWMITDNIIVTNRHVAQLVAIKKGTVLDFRVNPVGETMEAFIDFKEEYAGSDASRTSFEVQVLKILYVADDKPSSPDIALLELQKHPKLPVPIPLSDTKLYARQSVAVIGYPAYDPRGIISPSAASTVFGSIYDVKRCSPGEVTIFEDNEWYFNHDCTTLGGNSGSPVIDMATGNSVGLHFMGEVKKENYAVKADQLVKLLRKIKLKVYVNSQVNTKVAEQAVEEAVPENRTGFDDAFLGKKYVVPLPVVKDPVMKKQVLTFEENGSKTEILRYQHFSVVMNSERRLCFFSAVNIDGKSSKRGIKRAAWKWDNRIDKKFQIMQECYGNSPKFSKGHMTRKEDPVWGTMEEAKMGCDDTFFVTNVTPQMQPFNAPIWLALEDYALEHARQDEMKISVITGPILNSDDPEMYGVKIPVEFFKVIVFIHDETKKLCATGYTISQQNQLRNVEFVFGAFQTYQLPIKAIEAKTGLDFHQLRGADPLKGNGKESPVSGPLNSVEEIIFTK